MDLFAIFPHLAASPLPPLHRRKLRLIALAGLVYDDEAFYFELRGERFWVRTPGQPPLIGVGTAQTRPDHLVHAPVTLLQRHLRRTWRCDVTLLTTRHTYILDERHQLSLLTETTPATPYLLILTPPRLGGAEVPDALVQALYLLPLRRWRNRWPPRVNLLRIARTALGDFLTPQTWPLTDLLTRPWAALYPAAPLPDTAHLRPVLALRGLRYLWQEGLLSPFHPELE